MPIDTALPTGAGLPKWLFAALLCLPYWLIWLSPVASAPPDTIATGFPQYDQPYYLANGRAVFERGNGLAGPNPYDPDLAAPPIYFHLLTWCFGLAVVGARLDPGLVYVVTGLASGLVFARLTLDLLERLVSSKRSLTLLGMLAMWGGGIATMAWFLTSRLGLIKGDAPAFAFEPGGGWWFLPWGRNLVYTTEAFYHCLVLAIFIAFFDRRWWRLTLMMTLLAMSHPFTAAQVLLGVGLWVGLNLFAPKVTGIARLPWRVMATLAAVAAAFGAYYFLFLPSHVSHIEMTRSWALDWQETFAETLCAYLPLVVAVSFAYRRGLILKYAEQVFFGLFAILAFLLAHHGLFAPAHQPLHFSHGYLWFPLFLLALPWLERGALWALAGGPKRKLLAVLLILLAASDNVMFIAEAIGGRPHRDVRFIDRELRETYRFAEQEGIQGVVVSNDALASYLAATYTQMRPFFGHNINTPDGVERLAELDAFFGSGRQGPRIVAADLLLLKGRMQVGSPWLPLYEGERWKLYRRFPVEPQKEKR